jgi:lysophospholipase L1-like esterase
MRILVFGDSIAYGEYDSRGGWATRLQVDYFAERVKQQRAGLPLLYNLSIGGDITAHLTKRLPAEIEARRPLWSDSFDIALVIAIGINDSGFHNGQAVSSPERYAADLQALYDQARRYTDKLLLEGLTPVEQDNDSYTNDRIWQFEQTLRRFAEEKGAPHVPLFETFQAHLKKEPKLFVDGLHPNDKGHQLIYAAVKPQLKKLAS